MGRKKGKIYKGKNRSQNDDEDSEEEVVQTSGKYSSVKGRSSVKNSGKYITESEKNEDTNEEEENQEESNNNRAEDDEEDDDDNEDDDEDRKYNDRPEEKVFTFLTFSFFVCAN